MIFRLTGKMAQKIKESPTSSVPAAANSYTDWTSHVFRAPRPQYVIVTNTTSLYSVILHGHGITDFDRFVNYSLSAMADFMSDDGFEFQFRRLIAPSAKEIVFSKVGDRRVTGSMNDLVKMAQWHLAHEELSPFDAARMINQSPMSYLDHDSPKSAFGKLQPPTQDPNP